MPSEREAVTGRRSDKVLELLSAIVRQDAVPADISAAMRNEGVDSIDDLVFAFAEGVGDARAGLTSAMSPINLRDFSAPTPAASAPGAAHRVPGVPFLLNGTLYDPEDVRRFNDRALHFSQTASGDHLLAVDDRSVMARIWEYSYILRQTDPGLLEGYAHGGFHFHPGVRPQGAPSGRPSGPTIIPPPSKGDGVFMFEDMHFGGDMISLPVGKNYNNLTRVGKGFALLWIDFDDWNDTISSVRTTSASVTCVLYEHVSFGIWDGGDSLTLHHSEPFLEVLGWNDRVSSVAAF